MPGKSVTLSELRARIRAGQPAETGSAFSAEPVWQKPMLSVPAKQPVQRHSAPSENGFSGTMSRSPVPMRDGRPVYVDAASGRYMSEKPEEMTHLKGNLLVPKTHPRIAFRGQLDSLTAEILCMQEAACSAGNRELAGELQGVLEYTRTILGAEVKEEPLQEIWLEGMDAAAIRRASHNIREAAGIDHPIPDFRMGAQAVSLNRLRTKIRETELAAARAFTNTAGYCSRQDIVEGLNRLSSYVYILFCREAARQQKRPGSGASPAESTTAANPIPVEVSARHVHLSEDTIARLFGRGYQLTYVRDLSQPGQFLSAEKVKLAGPKGVFERVSILGPLRKELQAEISLSDARVLGIEAPIRLSGDLKGAADLTISGPAGTIQARECAIVAKEHLHMPTEMASEYGVRDGEHVRIRVDTERGMTLDDVIVRVSDTAGLAVHIDTDQANAAQVKGEVSGYLLKK